MAPPAEISIPTTSMSTPSDSKPFTLYNITLRLPLRSFVVQKRYSDFAALHQTLTSLVGSPPPAPLPSKSWFKSTLNSPELTEERRLGLERYLRAIAESPDRRWRDTPAWRAFLNLPGGSSAANSAASASGIGIDGRVPAIGHAAANAAAASDPSTWLDLHRELKGALHEARLCLARRDAAASEGAGKVGSAAVEAGAAAKRALVRAGSLLIALNEGLKTMGEKSRLGEGEMRRRRDLVAAARAERDGLEKLSASLASSRGSSLAASSISREGTPGVGDRAALLSGGSSSGGARAGGRVLGAPLPETERTRELDNDGVLLLQRQQMADQDQDVDALAKIVRRQKEMGLAIKEEVDRHTEMLDRLNDDADRVAGKVRVAKERTRRLG
ncbi:PX domain-containing protein [Pleurostoma richardsiae]|uniref:PX domain-containing protein n=1 Tax=Pleurostoma richardsiae TaxID=41990 RepID=A0AA38VI19_9PEZI|nr:PX domain-containing protein [Pleurostoma richardsiae]